MISQKQLNNNLAPENRLLLSRYLRPPDGHSFHSGLATTFSLDFRTALEIPIHLAFNSDYRIEDPEKQEIPTLESIDRIAGNLLMFLNVGNVHAPKIPVSKLWPLLENNVIEVSVPNSDKGGVFHPKIIVLRFNSESKHKPTRMRLLILSRNLTNDRSWDTVLSLDGKIGKTVNSYNEPIEKLIRKLPQWANYFDKKNLPLVEEMANDLVRTIWQPPSNFDNSVNFFVHGLGDEFTKYEWDFEQYFENCDKLGIISPFCSEEVLKELAELSSKENLYLLGRSEELTDISQQVLDMFGSVQVMEEEEEELDSENEEEIEVENFAEDKDELLNTGLHGLHAKVYVAEINKKTQITMGSGNATNAALKSRTNVEVFAALSGDKSKICGVEEIFGKSGIGFFTSDFNAIDDMDSTSENEIRDRLNKTWRIICKLDITLICEKDTMNEGEDRWNLKLEFPNKIELPDISNLSLRLVTMKNKYAVNALPLIQFGSPIIFKNVDLINLTRFIEFELTDKETEKSLFFCRGFCIEGIPENRISSIYRSILNDKNSLLLMLRLLFLDHENSAASFLFSNRDQIGSSIGNMEDDLPILEELVMSYCRDEKILHRVNKFIENIESLEVKDGEKLLDKFKRFWSVFSNLNTKPNGIDANGKKNRE